MHSPVAKCSSDVCLYNKGLYHIQTCNTLPHTSAVGHRANAFLVSMQADQKQMKLKVLQKVLVSKGLARVDQASSKHAQLMKDGLLKALSSSSQFVIQGKVVSLSA
jgi:hypothetical protein